MNSKAYDKATVELYTGLIKDQLKPYIVAARQWWTDADKFCPRATGTMPYEGGPNGMCIRFARTPALSPLRGIQSFPFVPSTYLDIQFVPGGIKKMIKHVCDIGLTMEEFTIIEKSNLSSTFTQGQLLCLVPTVTLNELPCDRWIFMRDEEIHMVMEGIVPEEVKEKCARALDLVDDYIDDTVKAPATAD
jgi:hypothetical protein